MSAGVHNYIDTYSFKQGDKWAWRVRLKTAPTVGRNLTGLTPRMQIRKKQRKDADIVLTFAVAVPPATGIAVGNQANPAEAGWIDFLAVSADTTNLVPGIWFYDLQLTNGTGQVETVLEGQFQITPQVTV